MKRYEWVPMKPPKKRRRGYCASIRAGIRDGDIRYNEKKERWERKELLPEQGGEG